MVDSLSRIIAHDERVGRQGLAFNMCYPSCESAASNNTWHPHEQLKTKRYASGNGPVSVFRMLYCDQENEQYRCGKVIRQDSSDDAWCLSALQAIRDRFDEKLWIGKNEPKFDKQHELIPLATDIFVLYRLYITYLSPFRNRRINRILY